MDKTNPIHYTRYKKQPILEFFETFGDGPALCNISKYLLRHDAKEGQVDIEKAIRYTQFCFNWYQYVDLFDKRVNSKKANDCVTEMLDKDIKHILDVKRFVRKYDRA